MNGSWDNMQALVMDRLEDLKTGQERQDEMLMEIKLELSSLKAKATVWGGVAGFIIGIIPDLYKKFHG